MTENNVYLVILIENNFAIQTELCFKQTEANVLLTLFVPNNCSGLDRWTMVETLKLLMY